MRRRAATAPGAEGLQLRTGFTVLSDLSANVFAALLLILIVLLQIKALASEAQTTRQAPPAPIDAMTDLGAVARRPLKATEIVGLLQRRNPRAAGLSVDVADDHLGFVEDGRATDIPAGQVPTGLDAALQQRDPGAPIRLYVFANRLYGPVVERLRQAGTTWEELSVPQALRDTDDTGRWSSDFLSLVAQPTDLATFRTGLAHLLAASQDRLVPQGHVAGRPGSGTASPSGAAAARATSLLDRLLGWLGVALAVTMLLAGLALVASTEWLVPSARVRYRAASDMDL